MFLTFNRRHKTEPRKSLKAAFQQFRVGWCKKPEKWKNSTKSGNVGISGSLQYPGIIVGELAESATRHPSGVWWWMRKDEESR